MSTALNRRLAPPTREIKKLNFPLCERSAGRTGVPVYSFKADTQEVLRIEFVFDAGLVKQAQKALASAVNAMLSEGTARRSAEQIADSLDYFGSYFQPRCLVDDAQVTLYCLQKHLPDCLQIIEDVLVNSQFPDNELSIYLKNSSQKLKVQQEKTSYLCRKAFYKNLFGESSPISSFSESSDYFAISRETLIPFYQVNYLSGIKYITVAGDVSDHIIRLLLDASELFKPSAGTNHYQVISNPEKKLILKKEGSAQATIRMGRQIINRKHAEFRKLQVANLVLGGYFGSRLMKNIREEKGLTYGIYSVLESYLDDACFYIEADVNSKKADLAIREIESELSRLNEELIDDKELNTAKSYFLGSILRGIDGPFTIMDRNRIMIDYGFGADYYDEFLELISSISSAEIRDLFNRYLRPEMLVHVVCGG